MNKSKLNKKIAKEALENSGGIISHAAVKLNVSRTTLYSFMTKHPDLIEFKNAVEEKNLDLAEDQLLTQIKSGVTPAIIFYLKTKGRRRGYSEKSEMDITSCGAPITTIRLIEVQNINES